MPSQIPSQRKLGTRFLTPSGWVVGTLHVPDKQPLLAFLNATEAFFRLTNVSLPEQPESLPFLALARHAALIVVPPSDAHLGIEVHPNYVRHEVVCLFDGGLLMGTLPLPSGVRVSDELMHSEQFFVVENCTVGLDSAVEATMEAEPLVLVQASQLFGVAELETDA